MTRAQKRSTKDSYFKEDDRALPLKDTKETLPSAGLVTPTWTNLPARQAIMLEQSCLPSSEPTTYVTPSR